MASTQFEALDARRAFSCWDEPAQKATFDVSLTVGAKYTALSNMPESETRYHANGTKTLKFMTTPIMSTYLLAYVIGEFDMVQCVSNNGISIHVFVPLGDADKAYFSLDVAKRCLDFYDDCFQVPYPLPKLDMVAMPEFAAGAMENWGLVTYRQASRPHDRFLEGYRVAATACCLRRDPRTSAPVVRQPRHDALVGRSVAERGLRLVDGRPGHRALPPRMERRAGGRGRP